MVKLIFTLAGVVCFSQLAQAQCKRAGDNDSPHGANEFVLLDGKSVGRIHGRVFFPNYMHNRGERGLKILSRSFTAIAVETATRT
jgi:hypothetical protein